MWAGEGEGRKERGGKEEEKKEKETEYNEEL